MKSFDGINSKATTDFDDNIDDPIYKVDIYSQK